MVFSYFYTRIQQKCYSVQCKQIHLAFLQRTLSRLNTGCVNLELVLVSTFTSPHPPWHLRLRFLCVEADVRGDSTTATQLLAAVILSTAPATPRPAPFHAMTCLERRGKKSPSTPESRTLASTISHSFPPAWVPHLEQKLSPTTVLKPKDLLLVLLGRMK